MTAPAPDELLPALHKAADNVAADAARFSDEDAKAPSALPGWTRGHVLAHLTGISNAMARQLEYAARGEAVELYDGGMEGRNKAIDMAAGHDAATHLADLTHGAAFHDHRPVGVRAHVREVMAVVDVGCTVQR